MKRMSTSKEMDLLWEAVEGDQTSIAELKAYYRELGMNFHAEVERARRRWAPLMERSRRIVALYDSLSATSGGGFPWEALSKDAFEEWFVEELNPPLPGTPGHRWIAFRDRCEASGVKMTYATLAEWSGLSSNYLKKARGK